MARALDVQNATSQLFGLCQISPLNLMATIASAELAVALKRPSKDSIAYEEPDAGSSPGQASRSTVLVNLSPISDEVLGPVR